MEGGDLDQHMELIRRKAKGNLFKKGTKSILELFPLSRRIRYKEKKRRREEERRRKEKRREEKRREEKRREEKGEKRI